MGGNWEVGVGGACGGGGVGGVRGRSDFAAESLTFESLMFHQSVCETRTLWSAPAKNHHF